MSSQLNILDLWIMTKESKPKTKTIPKTVLSRTVKEVLLSQLPSKLERVRNKTIDIVLSPYRFFKAVCFTVGLITILILGGSGTGIYFFFDSLPKIADQSKDDLKKIAQKHIKASRESKRKKHRWIDLQYMSRDLIYAIVISEDAEFFEHDGINYEALVSAFAKNYKKKKFVSGASTITQQVSKNLFLDQEKSISRKLKEYFVSRDLDTYMSKNDILEIYLNIAEFGPDIFGIREAGKYYFNKHPSKLDAGEAAFLALMLPSPRKNHYSIFVKKNYSKVKRRKVRTVLRGMLYKEYISAKEYKKFVNTNYLSH